MSDSHSRVHPGEVLFEEFLEPMGVSPHRLARAINVPARRINEIVLGKRRISPETASRLARVFGTSDRFWTNLQTRYDLELVAEAKGDELDRIVPLLSACFV
ncbi:HigA family addiction module antidote protein [Herbiconiux sp. VKM Ac-1786]|uniref:HigA family addiction module antitoxin n=1 Tax=Herbiconiux sp. VKM Ac-1786 TaxID=2783824 RepID=UPI00188D5E7E|nr:HigA family addiction module antidote protein [Herbiconiux sp. VKM Ac-1786]